jgi:hypothetical protein
MLKSGWKSTKTLVCSLIDLSPVAVVPLVFVYAVILGAISFPMGTSHACKLTGEIFCKSVGYWSAPNWFLNSVLVLPLFLLFLYFAIRSIPRLLDQLAGNRMIVNEAFIPFQPGSQNPSKVSWDEQKNRAVPWLSAVLMLIVAAVIWEWAATSAVPLITGSLEHVAECEHDWAIAALLVEKPTALGRTANALFSLLAFALQGVMIFALMTLFALSFLLTNFIHHSHENWQVVPNPDDSDDKNRRGFQLFEEPISLIFIAALMALAMLYLSILQNQYIRSQSLSLMNFTSSTVFSASAVFTERNPIPDGLHEEPVADSETLECGNTNFSSSMSVMGGLVVLALVGGLPLFFLRGLAQRGRNALVNSGKVGDFEMDYWPFSYLPLSIYLVVVVVALASLIYYKYGLYFFGLIILWAILRAMGMIKNSISNE